MDTPTETQPPVFIVEGSNWTCETILDEMNASFPYEEQVIEAGTKAIEVFKGLIENETFTLRDDKADAEPYIGIALHVYLKNTNPNKTGRIVASHICLANGGFYKDSFIVAKHFASYAKQFSRPTTKNVEEQIKNFEALKKALKNKKAKQSRKSPKNTKKKKK